MTTPPNKYRKIFGTADEKHTLSTLDKDKLLTSILKEGRRHKQKMLTLRLAGIAAVFLAVFFIFYPPFQKQTRELDLLAVAQLSKQNFQSDSAIQVLSLDVHNEQATTAAMQFVDENATEAILTYDAQSQSLSNRYKTIYVPYGKRQEFVLPDRSVAWLNAGSYLTFKEGMQEGDREVYLNGEGYFDVQHNGRPFVVRTKHADVKVLGTTFNVFGYEEEHTAIVELLTGKVEVYSPQQSFSPTAMSPGQQFVVNTQSKKTRLQNYRNEDGVLWTKKQIALDNVSLKALFSRMERVYNVTIHADKSVQEIDLSYSGRLNVEVDVVSALKSIYELKDYRITMKEREVLIKKE